jgi:hypothetical protein
MVQDTWNLTLSLIECVENNITLGEICNTLRGVWGVCGAGVLEWILVDSHFV